ncbi:TetR/AcrR family transcriptional regulator [Candidatus Gracilibacteria bacterium]|nr:TetR/AcrR family transcriptional regulator [Candidatus Gracilibacteria bacterium]
MGRPREFDRDRAVQQAMELFWRRGYEATSVQELGSAMGLNPGSLYNAFGDKHSLFLEALQCYQNREYTAACDNFRRWGTGRVAIERFFVFVVDYDLADTDRKGCLMVNSAAELADHDLDVKARVLASRTQMATLFHTAIVQGQQVGEIASLRSATELAEFLVNALFGLRITVKVQHDREVLLAIVAATLRALD